MACSEGKASLANRLVCFAPLRAASTPGVRSSAPAMPGIANCWAVERNDRHMVCQLKQKCVPVYERAPHRQRMV